MRMAVYRVEFLTEDPWAVFKWIEDNVPKELVVRKMAYETVKGWYLKAVFKRQSDAESFHRRCYPEAGDHTVEVYGSPT